MPCAAFLCLLSPSLNNSSPHFKLPAGIAFSRKSSWTSPPPSLAYYISLLFAPTCTLLTLRLPDCFTVICLFISRVRLWAHWEQWLLRSLLYPQQLAESPRGGTQRWTWEVAWATWWVTLCVMWIWTLASRNMGTLTIFQQRCGEIKFNFRNKALMTHIEIRD